MSTLTATEQIISAQKSAYDVLLSIANSSLNSLEKINTLNLSTARSALARQFDGISSRLATQDLSKAFAQQNALAQAQIAQAVAYGRALYEISAETQEAFVDLLESRQAELSQEISTLLDGYAKSSNNNDLAIAAVKSAISAANSALQNANKAARQVAGITGAGVSATVEAIGTANQNQGTSRKKAA